MLNFISQVLGKENRSHDGGGDLRISGVADWLQAGSEVTSARSSLPALLSAELGYNLRLHGGYPDAAIRSSASTVTSARPANTRAGLLRLRLGHRPGLGREPGFQRGQGGLDGGRGQPWLFIYTAGSARSGHRLFVNRAGEGRERVQEGDPYAAGRSHRGGLEPRGSEAPLPGFGPTSSDGRTERRRKKKG